MQWLLPDEAEKLLKRRWQIINVGTSTEAFHLFGEHIVLTRYPGLASNKDHLQGPPCSR